MGTELINFRNLLKIRFLQNDLVHIGSVFYDLCLMPDA